MNRPFAQVLAGLVVLVASACGNKAEEGPPPAVPVADLAGKFVFEPTLGKAYRHTMKRLETFEIVDTEVKTREEWESRWLMSITMAGDAFLYRGELEYLSIAINQADVLLGPEVKGRGGVIEITLDRQGRLLDVQKAETITQALLEISTPEFRPQIAAMFAPESLRLLFALRTSERTQDLIGQSAQLGATWTGTAMGPQGQPVAKKLEVKAYEDCGMVRCVKVERELFIDRGRVWAGAEQQVKAYVSARGNDPEKVELLDADIRLVDDLIVDPRTMEFYGARFEQSAEWKVRTPSGEYFAKQATIRESSYQY